VRVYFRRFRIAVLLTLFVLVVIGVYLNQVGLPDFAKRPLLANLRSHGVNLEFSRLRLRGYRGIVAEDVRLSNGGNQSMPGFSAKSADVRLDYAALARLQIEVLGVTLNKGSLRWDLASEEAPGQELLITNLMADLQFLPGDCWSLDRLEAEYRGARFYVVGQITNASHLATLFQRKGKAPPGAFLDQLRKVERILDRIRFDQPPEFRLSLTGDGRSLTSFKGVFTLDAPDASTPWGEFAGAQLTARLDGKVLENAVDAQVTLHAVQVQTKWARLENLFLESNGSQIATNEVRCDATLRASNLGGDWGTANTVEIQSEWSHRPQEIKPYIGKVRIFASQVATRWASADAADLTASGRPTTDWMAMDDPDLGAWNNLLPYALQLSCAATNLKAGGLEAESAGLTAVWDAPHLRLSDVHGRLAGGQAMLDAELDVLTRQLELDGHAQLDFHQLGPVLTEKSRDWLDHFSWDHTPAVAMRGSLTLPVWTNRSPDWRGQVQPSIVLEGSVQVTNASYRDIRALEAQTHLQYSNRVWRLPDLTLVRPEGTLQVDLQSDEISHDYAIRLQGPFDPRAIAPQLDEKGQRGLGYFEFTEVPWLAGEVRGSWYDPARLWARADVAWTNVTYRGQHADRIAASVEYSNKVLQVTHPFVQRGTQHASADGILFDFVAKKAYLTNGYSDTDPMVIARVIGPKTAAAVEPYQFLSPPVATVYGVIPLQGEREADLHFDLSGGPFHWSRFKVPQISGQVHWANESVTLTNMVTSFYGGRAEGNAWFDVSTPGSTPFHFGVTVSNASLNALMADLHSPTNQLEGILNGELNVTNANTASWTSWNGYGRATLQNGLIWDTPIFGMMSSVLNTIVPGIGNSRASDASGTYTIENSLIRTRDLDIRASGMRLLYNGTVDFQTRVNARVEAELLRDTWFVGKLVSTALWPVSKLFVYRVTGTLAAPNTEPLYLVPKLVLVPLHPMKTFKDMLQPEEPEANYDALPDLLLTPSLPPEPTPTEPTEEPVQPAEEK